MKNLRFGKVRNQLIAQRYVESIDSGDSVLVISPSIAEKEEVTQAIREKLKADGRIGGHEITVDTLKPYGWTKAQREDACLYRTGDVIEFHAKGKGGFKPGDRARVSTIDDDRVMVDAGGQQRVLPLSSSGAFDVAPTF